MLSREYDLQEHLQKLLRLQELKSEMFLTLKQFETTLRDLSHFNIAIRTQSGRSKRPLNRDCYLSTDYGPTNTGKTQWAAHMFDSPLIVSDMDDLAHFNSTHDGIIFDDMSFHHVPREPCIHLLDWDFARSIRVRYKCAHIPAGTRKIFTSNKPFDQTFPPDDTGAIQRRVTKVIHVTGPTFIRQPQEADKEEAPENEQ